MLTAETICIKLGLDLKDILNIYPYGSKVYGTNTEDSDDDFIIVYKGSLLPSGSFKDNAISSHDWKVQGSCYSRGGFLDAINNYQISVLECIFLPEEMIVMKKMDFKITKYYEPEMIKKVITTASSSMHFANMSFKDDLIEPAKKNVFHAIRVLDFGNQIKEHGKIVDYGSMYFFKREVDYDRNFHIKPYKVLFNEYREKLKNEKLHTH